MCPMFECFFYTSHYYYIPSIELDLYDNALVLIPVLALAPLEALDIRLLDNKHTAVNRVNHNVSRLKSVGRPSTAVPERIATTGLNVIGRENIKVADFL